MNLYIVFVILICISATFAYINQKFIKIPFVIGLFLLSTIITLLVLSIRLFIPQPYVGLKELVEHTDISGFILNVMLGFLLFAGSLHTNWLHIREQLKKITLLAIAGVLISTVVIAILFYGASLLIHIKIDFIYCLLFGALISPTDPVAVLGILTKAGVPKKIESIIVGESLFNDGVGVVVFIALLETAQSGGNTFSFSHFGMLFLKEAAGGILFGLIAGYLLHFIINKIDNYETEVLLTIAFVMGGYAAALALHISGPLAMVVMGLLLGNYKSHTTMSNTSKEYVYKFWEVIDVILNALLFIIIATVLIVIDFKPSYFLIAIISVLIVFISRVIVVYLPKIIAPKTFNIDNSEAKLLVWGGLRGGLSIALVLSLPESNEKYIILLATYCCVVFSILVQGLTIKKLIK